MGPNSEPLSVRRVPPAVGRPESGAALWTAGGDALRKELR